MCPKKMTHIAVVPAINDTNTSFMTSSSGAVAGAGAATTLDSTKTAKAIELSENFYITNRRKSNVKIQVKLSGEGIYLRRETEENDEINEQLIRIEDIIGSCCGQRIKKRARGGLTSCKRASPSREADGECNDGSAKDTCAYLYIYAYVKREKPSVRRDRTVRILRFRSFERYAENLKSAERWHRGIQVNKGQFAIDEMPGEQKKKEILILLNPKSGSGKGREMFQKQVAPVLKEAELKYDLQVTTYANFAREFVRMRKDLLQRYSGIIVASGDGLFYEVLNGLMERADWRMVTSLLPLGIIPCGSGNGLARSIAHEYNEPYDTKPILNATLTCVSGNSAPMDIVRIELASKGDNKQTEMYSFLSVGWGLIADVDIQSERLRSIGAPRFAIWTIHRLIHLRTYKGKLSYLPWKKEYKVAPSTSPQQQQQPTATVNVKSENSKEQEFFDIPINDGNEGDDDVFADAISISVDTTSFRSHVNSWHSATSRSTAYYSIAGGQSTRSRRSILSKIEAANAEFEIERGRSSTMPPLSIPLPIDGSEWHCEEGEYIMVHAAYTTHLATDVLFAPDSLLNDGTIYLVIIRSGCSRSQLLQFFMGMSTGTHLPDEPNEYIQVVPVRAFRIEPSGNDGIIAVDGERVNYGPIQGEIVPGMINVMVPNRK